MKLTTNAKPLVVAHIKVQKRSIHLYILKYILHSNISLSVLTAFSILLQYTARIATELLQVVEFTGMLQVVNKLQKAC